MERFDLIDAAAWLAAIVGAVLGLRVALRPFRTSKGGSGG
jgi:hypothetical protein